MSARKQLKAIPGLEEKHLPITVIPDDLLSTHFNCDKASWGSRVEFTSLADILASYRADVERALALSGKGCSKTASKNSSPQP